MATPTWHRLCAFLVCALAATPVASADAIMPFDGECFPGSRRAISNHAEACIPNECASDDDCGDDAHCETLCVCRAERTFTNDGRVVYAEPRTEVVEVGLCDAQGACAEGDVAERRQCEPDADTPAFDRERHRWTGETHVASSGGSPSGGSCAGCAVPADAPLGTPAAGLVALLGLLGWRLSRRR